MFNKGSDIDVPIDFSQFFAKIFHTRKVIASSLQICYSEKGLSTAPWPFFLSVAPFLSLLLLYKKGEKLVKEVLIVCNGF